MGYVSSEFVKAQLRFAVNMMAGGLSMFTAPGVAEVLSRVCSEDGETREAVRRLAEAVRRVESSCLGQSGQREDLIRKLLDELERCEDIECVRSVVGEYKVILTIKPVG